MGCKPVEDKQTHIVQVKFSAEQLGRVKAAAQKMGVPMSVFIKIVVAKHLEEK